MPVPPWLKFFQEQLGRYTGGCTSLTPEIIRSIKNQQSDETCTVILRENLEALLSSGTKFTSNEECIQYLAKHAGYCRPGLSDNMGTEVGIC